MKTTTGPNTFTYEFSQEEPPLPHTNIIQTLRELKKVEALPNSFMTTV